MMPENFHIVVEGDEDFWFLQGYLSFLLGSSVSSKCFKNLRGLGNLGGYTQDIRVALRKGAKVLIVLDANSSHRERRQEAQNILGKYIPGGLDLPLFLFPDNQSNGAVENLLEQIIIPGHEDIFACFEGYKECLKECDRNYTPPGIKGKIYSYKEALGALHKSEKRKQYAPGYWDFDNSALEPLKDFLTSNIL